MSGGLRCYIALAVAALSSACLDASVTECPGGVICPAGTACDPRGGCISPEQTTACTGKQEGDACSFGGVDGLCSGGTCYAAGCGDGFARGLEKCDGTDQRGVTDCFQLGYHEHGPLGCTTSCTYDTTACGTSCGDGVVNGPEDCDDTDLGQLTNCRDLGFYDDVPLSCNSLCRYDVAACSGYCGDGVVNGPEDCDTTDLGSATDCTSIGYYDVGTLGCDASCRYDTAGCTGYCGDETLNGAEACDHLDVGTTTCQDLGYYDPVLPSCTGACTLDPSPCTGYCGDRVRNGGELCEGQSPPGQTCGGLGFDEGVIDCSASCSPVFAGCIHHGWRADSTPNNNQYFVDLWGPSRDDVFLIANAGYHWDGRAWSQTSGPGNGYNAIWGTAHGDVFAVGNGGAIRHYDGSAWSAMTSGTGNTLLDVSGTAPSDVFAVGNGGTIRHYDGAGWSAMTSPVTTALTGVWAHTATDVFAVGVGGVLLHYDGAWSTMSSPTTQDLAAVWGAGDDVFAGGAGGTLLHYDGVAWTAMASPTTRDIPDVWAAAPDDVYATTYGGAVIHYDGAAWQSVPESQQVWANGGQGLFGFAGTDLFVTAPYYRILHADLATWHDTAGGSADSIFALAPDDVWAVSGSSPLVSHFDGSTWLQMPTDDFDYYYGVWADASDDVFVVGYNGNVWRWDGTSWKEPRVGPGDFLFDVWGTGPTDVFAVGYGPIVHWDGSTWSEIPTGLDINTALRDVWGSAPDHYVAVGEYGTLLGYDGTSWSSLASPTTGALEAVWGTAADDYYIGGSDGIYHWDGHAWTHEVSHQVYEIWGTGPNDVYASGRAGIDRFDGLGWGAMKQQSGSYIRGLGGAGATVYAGSFDASMQRLVRACDARELDCGDGRDDDCDGDYDCVDADCAGSPSCPAGGLCAGAIDLACDTPVAGTTAPGSSTIDRYGCSMWLDDGREVFYRLVAPASGPITVDLTGTSSDLDLIVLAEGPGGGCDVRASGCLGASSSTGAEQVRFDAVAGTAYDIVVDGYGSASGGFTLAASCP